MRAFANDDQILLALLRALPDVPLEVRAASAASTALLERAEMHGVAGVVQDALANVGTIAMSPLLERRKIARELDHGAHLSTLRAIDKALHDASISSVALKGPLFAERFYPSPSTRGTSDIDLLVAEADIDRAVAALAEVGYVAASGPDEDRFRREHHHLHLECAHGPTLELHFHAYRGFGSILRSEPLIGRRRIVELRSAATTATTLRAIGVLAPEDELVYLAVHAAAHRFVRLGWLYDLVLLVNSMSQEQLACSADRARTLGYEQVLAFTADLLREELAVPPAHLAALGSLRGVHRSFVRVFTPEPAARLPRAVTRFIYVSALCPSPAAAVRQGASTVVNRLRLLLRDQRDQRA